ncbi:hypothetical protein ACOME3_008899 [Neoechinorhynchus agilis]
MSVSMRPVCYNSNSAHLRAPSPSMTKKYKLLGIDGDIPPPPGLEFLVVRKCSSYQSTPSPTSITDEWHLSDVQESEVQDNEIDDLIAFAAGSLNISGSYQSNQSSNPYYRRLFTILQERAKLHRQAAINKSIKNMPFWQSRDAIVPSVTTSSFDFSRKVFIGGIPWSMSDQQVRHVVNMLVPHAIVMIDWPQKCPAQRRSGLPGYCYAVFEDSSVVRTLLQNCFRDPLGRFFMSVKQVYSGSSKKIEIIPWRTCDYFHVNAKYLQQCNSNRDEMLSRKRMTIKRTVFVGALHGMISANLLARIMSEKFGPVAEARIDTDRYRYPIGSGRVTFLHDLSYRKAIADRFLRLKTPTFKKVLQIDPFLFDEPCSMCKNFAHLFAPIRKSTIAFCRTCFEYFCPICWFDHHREGSAYNGSKEELHIPLMRDFRSYDDHEAFDRCSTDSGTS